MSFKKQVVIAIGVQIFLKRIPTFGDSVAIKSPHAGHAGHDMFFFGKSWSQSL